jgi:pyrroline-5-carboxylate reductase
MPPKTATIAFIGAGNMGEAMLRGLAKAGHSKEGLRAFDLRTDRLKALSSEAGFTAVDSVAQAVDGADVVVLAVKPQSFDGLLRELAPRVGEGQTLVSIAAGIRLERLGAALAATPAVRLVRVMPNTPGLIGQGISAYCLGPTAGPEQAAQTEALLRPLGKVLRVREEDMDAVTALSGSGPAYVFLFMEALQAAGTGLGLSAEASFLLASQTLSGAAAMIQAREKSPAELRSAVTSPGGTTAAAIRVFEEGGLRSLVEKALDAASERSKELGR